MKQRIGIGITTYEDIASQESGAAIFDAYARVSDRIIPKQMDVWGIKSSIDGRDAFARSWLVEAPYEVRASVSESVDRGVFQLGAEWRCGDGGRGEVIFRPKLDSSRTNQIIINHAYSSRVDWLALFERLVEVTKPAYAMLHVFTAAEMAAPPQGERFEVFEGPFAGDEWFTSLRLPNGDWDVPDRLNLERRRAYRFLPELSWANALGQEFSGHYDPVVVADRAAKREQIGGADLFCITASISDVVDRYEAFDLARLRLRAAFPDSAFHRRKRNS